MVISAGLSAFFANIADNACATRGCGYARINEIQMGVASCPLSSYETIRSHYGTLCGTTTYCFWAKFPISCESRLMLEPPFGSSDNRCNNA